jgi:hypothetical protein
MQPTQGAKGQQYGRGHDPRVMSYLPPDCTRLVSRLVRQAPPRRTRLSYLGILFQRTPWLGEAGNAIYVMARYGHGDAHLKQYAQKLAATKDLKVAGPPLNRLGSDQD